MSGSNHGAIDYGRFAERLAAARANTDPAKRWDLYREFLGEWGYAPGGEPKPHGDYVRDLIGAAEGDDPEDDPGIPVALAEWWARPDNVWLCLELDESYAHWPPEWRPEDDPKAPGRLACFMSENQYCNEWAYLSADSQADDPTVFVSLGTRRWAVAAPSVSEFALLMAAVRLPPAFGWTAYPEDGFDEVAARVRATLPELGLPRWREVGAALRLYGASDVIVELDSGTGDYDYPVRACGRTREALEDLIASLGGEWEVCEPEAEAPANDQ